MRKLLIGLLFLLGACTMQFTPPTTPTTPPVEVPSEPIEEPTEPVVDNPPITIVESEFSDPFELIQEVKFDLIASPNGEGDCLTVQTSCNLTEALEQLQPGQILALRGGLYHAGAELNLGAGSQTTITAFGNEVPVIDGSANPQAIGLTLVGDNIRVTGLHFRYNLTGLLVQGNNNLIEHVTSYSNRIEGMSLEGSQNILNDVKVQGNSVGVQSVGSLSIIRYSEFRDNQQGLILRAPNSTVEYSQFFGNLQGALMDKGTLRFSIAKDNDVGFITVAESLVYNNTVIGGGQGFVSSTASGQQPSIFFYNLIYETELPSLFYDSTVYNSWQLNISDPLFITMDEESPLFGYVTITSPVLNPPIPQGLPVSDFRSRLGALGSP